MGYAPTQNLVQMRFFVTVDGYEHQLSLWGEPDTWPLTPGLAPTAYNFYTHAGGTATYAAAADAYWGAIDDFYDANDAAFGRCEFWAYAAGSQNATYLTVYNTAVLPVRAGAYVPAAELIFTARTDAGKTMKFTLEETNDPAAVPVVWNANAAGTIFERLGAHVLDAGSVYVARDGSKPIGLMRYFPGQNEALFKSRYARE